MHVAEDETEDVPLVIVVEDFLVARRSAHGEARGGRGEQLDAEPVLGRRGRDAEAALFSVAAGDGQDQRVVEEPLERLELLSHVRPPGCR